MDTETRTDPVAKLLDWLIAMDDPDSTEGMEARRTVTLTRIIDRARDVQRWHQLNATTDDRVAEVERLRREVDRGHHWEEMVLNHVPRDMWRGLGIHDYEPGT